MYKVFIVIKLYKSGQHEIIGVYANKNDAEKIAYSKKDAWYNVVEREVL